MLAERLRSGSDDPVVDDRVGRGERPGIAAVLDGGAEYGFLPIIGLRDWSKSVDTAKGPTAPPVPLLAW